MGQAGDAEDLTGETINATQSMVEAAGQDVSILKIGYLDLVRALADEVQKAQRESDATTRHLYEKEGWIWELKLKGRYLADDSVPVLDLKKRLAVWDARIAVLGEFSANLNKSFLSTTRSHGALRIEVDSSRATLARGARHLGFCR